MKENGVGKGEIAHYEQFLLFSQSFQKRLVLQTHENMGLLKKGLVRLCLCKYMKEKKTSLCTFISIPL